MSWLDFFPWWGPRFDWIQVEVTTHCQAACTYCPHTVYQAAWESRHLAPDTFRRLLPELRRTRLVYLQGWGEPFLHPDFFHLVSLAKQAGCQVGATTNGMLLDRERISRLVDLGMDVVAFSLAGIGEKNDRIRRGTRFAQVLETLKTLQDLKAQKGVSLPRVHLAYMLLSSGLDDLPLLPQTLRGLGVSQVVVSLLDFVAAPALARESLRFLPPEAYREVLARLDYLADQGRRLGVSISHHLPPPGRHIPSCPENVHRAVCVAADGLVSPCVYLNLPVTGETFVGPKGEQPYARQGFGQLARHSLGEIWGGPPCRRFRRAWRWKVLPPSCRNCLKSRTHHLLTFLKKPDSFHEQIVENINNYQ